MSSVSRLSRQILESNKAAAGVAFTGVTVITMSPEGVRRDQTVLVQGDTIVNVGDSSEASVPEGTRIVDARGKYLLPGLVDMHVHVSDETDLPLLLVHGVTTIRNMADLPGWVKAIIGFPDVLSLRRRVQAGSLLGPDVYTAGLALDGAPPVSPFNRVVATARDAQKEVDRLHRAGYDYVKVYDMLSKDAFDQILSAARSAQLPVIGHVPFQVGLERALGSEMASIEHLTGYVNNNTAGFIVPESELGLWSRRTRDRGIYNCPTLVIWDRLPAPGGLSQLERYEEFRFTSRRIRWLWRKTLQTVYEIEYTPKESYSGRMMSISKQMLRELHGARCQLLVGTDMNFVGVFPGISTLREIELFVETGIPPIEALEAATINAAKCLGKWDLFGSVTVGKRADLLLLNGNPLTDIRNIYDIAGVVVRGLWLDDSTLVRIKSSLAR